jgi:RNA polymerase sigma factor (sigma-70 family)
VDQDDSPLSAGVGALNTDDADRIDPAVVAGLFVEHEAGLRRFLLGVLRDRQAAADALQNAFAKMVERGHEVREESRKAWLYRVAFNEAMLLRRKRGAAERAVREAVWTHCRDEAAADDSVAHQEDVERVQAALRDLPAVQQQVVRMRIYEGKTFALIASELGIPLGTALARMRSALEKLRRNLKGD